jgi:hypothetical protein
VVRPRAGRLDIDDDPVDLDPAERVDDSSAVEVVADDARAVTPADTLQVNVGGAAAGFNGGGFGVPAAGAGDSEPSL